jgi:hypothetical protein
MLPLMNSLISVTRNLDKRNLLRQTLKCPGQIQSSLLTNRFVRCFPTSTRYKTIRANVSSTSHADGARAPHPHHISLNVYSLHPQRWHVLMTCGAAAVLYTSGRPAHIFEGTGSLHPLVAAAAVTTNWLIH